MVITDQQDEEQIVTKNFTTTKSEIVDILATNLPAIGTLIRIADIQASEQTETAEVTSIGIPVILYNPKFVDEHCESKAHFAMLLLHEIYHVMLGHTIKGRSGVSELDNIVADAIINSMICQQYQSFTFQSFFINLYDKEKMPQAVMRPKGRPPYFWQRRKYAKLYTPFGIPWDDLVQIVADDKERKVQLLGNHNRRGESNIPEQVIESVLAETLAPIEETVQQQINEETRRLENERWNRQWHHDRNMRNEHVTPAQRRESQKKLDDLQKKIDAIKSAGTGASVFVSILKQRLEVAKRKKELEDELRKVATQSIYSKLEAKLKGLFPRIPETSVIPNYRNRRAIVSLTEGLYNPFYKNLLRPKDFGVVTIYIDVSGSMNNYIQTVYKLACNCKDFLDEKIYLFSNKVEAINKEELLQGKVLSTGGTDDCFLAHAIEHKKRKIMVFTDGCLGVNPKHIREFKETRSILVACYTPSFQPLPKEIVFSSLEMDENGEAHKGKNKK